MKRINAKNQELIMIAWQRIAEVHEFTYLGATVFKEGDGMKDLKQTLKSEERICQIKEDQALKNDPVPRTKPRL